MSPRLYISHLLENYNSKKVQAFITTARTASPRLLAAIDAVLKLADDWEADSFIVDPEIALRATITTALSGTHPGEDGNP